MHVLIDWIREFSCLAACGCVVPVWEWWTDIMGMSMGIIFTLQSQIQIFQNNTNTNTNSHVHVVSYVWRSHTNIAYKCTHSWQSHDNVTFLYRLTRGSVFFLPDVHSSMCLLISLRSSCECFCSSVWIDDGQLTFYYDSTGIYCSSGSDFAALRCGVLVRNIAALGLCHANASAVSSQLHSQLRGQFHEMAVTESHTKWKSCWEANARQHSYI